MHRIDAWGVALVVCALALVTHDAVTGTTLILMFTVGLAYWLGYTINDYFDAPFDAKDRKGAHRNFFVAHRVPKGWAVAAYVVAVALVLSGFARFGLIGIVIFGVCVAAMWAYSAPPVRLKSRPGLDLVWHALFVQTFPYVLCVILIDATWTMLDYVLISINVFASLSGQLAQQVRDFDVDSSTDRTFATTVGLRAARMTLQILTVCLGVIVVVGFATEIVPWYLAPIAIAFVPVLLRRLQGSGERRRVVMYYCTGFSLVYAAGLVGVQFVTTL